MPPTATAKVAVMPNLTPVQRWSALLALALGGFAIGLTEFVAMGLLPQIAKSLLPGPYAAPAPPRRSPTPAG